METLRVETLRVETLRVETLRVETLRVETLRVETLRPARSTPTPACTPSSSTAARAGRMEMLRSRCGPAREVRSPDAWAVLRGELVRAVVGVRRSGPRSVASGAWGV